MKQKLTARQYLSRIKDRLVHLIFYGKNRSVCSYDQIRSCKYCKEQFNEWKKGNKPSERG